MVVRSKVPQQTRSFVGEAGMTEPTRTFLAAKEARAKIWGNSFSNGKIVTLSLGMFWHPGT